MSEQERVLPHDLAAEQSVIGGMLLSPTAILDVMDQMTPADFYDPKHALIAEAVVRLAAGNNPTDSVAVVDELLRVGQLSEAGGAEYVHRLTSIVPTAANAGYYAGIVHDRAVLRRLIAAGTRVAQMGYSGEGDPVDLVEAAKAELDRVTTATATEVHPIGESLNMLVDQMSEPPVLTPTPWGDVNELIGGLRPGALYVVGARPGTGKTVIGLNLAVQLAVKKGPVAFASLEMSEADLQKRLIAQFAEVEMGGLVNNSLTDAEWRKVSAVMPRLREAPIFIDDFSGATLARVQSFARSVARKGDLAGLVVDYLQLMENADMGRENRSTEVAGFSRGLKVLARNLNIPVIALSQLNRAPEARAAKRPTLADLRESGAIEQDADVVFLLSRDERDSGRGNVIEVDVAKNRLGRTGRLELLWEGKYARVRSVPWVPPGDGSSVSRRDLD